MRGQGAGEKGQARGAQVVFKPHSVHTTGFCINLHLCEWRGKSSGKSVLWSLGYIIYMLPVPSFVLLRVCHGSGPDTVWLDERPRRWVGCPAGDQSHLEVPRHHALGLCRQRASIAMIILPGDPSSSRANDHPPEPSWPRAIIPEDDGRQANPSLLISELL